MKSTPDSFTEKSPIEQWTLPKGFDVAKIGCVTVIPYVGGGFIGIDCAKGRGPILPGGKWEGPPETFRSAAAREAFEEVGLRIFPEEMSFLWSGPDGFKFTTISFLAPPCEDFDSKPLPEGTPRIVHFNDLMKSKYEAYYDILFDVCRERLKEWM